VPVEQARGRNEANRVGGLIAINVHDE
jgi:hypothetical protein